MGSIWLGSQSEVGLRESVKNCLSHSLILHYCRQDICVSQRRNHGHTLLLNALVPAQGPRKTRFPQL